MKKKVATESPRKGTSLTEYLPEKYTETMLIRLSPRQMNLAEELAVRNKVTISFVVRFAIERLYEEEQEWSTKARKVVHQ